MQSIALHYQNSPTPFSFYVMHFGIIQVVLVIDRKLPRGLKLREMAFGDLQKVADSLNVNLTVR